MTRLYQDAEDIHVHRVAVERLTFTLDSSGFAAPTPATNSSTMVQATASHRAPMSVAVETHKLFLDWK